MLNGGVGQALFPFDPLELSSNWLNRKWKLNRIENYQIFGEKVGRIDENVGIVVQIVDKAHQIVSKSIFEIEFPVNRMNWKCMGHHFVELFTPRACFIYSTI